MTCDLELEIASGAAPGLFAVAVDSPARAASGTARLEESRASVTGRMGVGVADTEIELELGAAAQLGEYVVHVVHAASGGEPETRLWLDVDDLVTRRAQLEARVLASAAGARGGVVPEIEQPLRQAGQELFEALFSGPVAEVYRASLAVARERGRLLGVVLRLTAPELSVLPWEALFDPVIQAYVCRKEPLVRHVPAPFSPEPLPVHPPLRILGLIAPPGSADAGCGDRTAASRGGARRPGRGTAGRAGVAGAGLLGQRA